MISDEFERTIKLPVRIVNGAPQPFYGPTWPKLKDGSIGDLMLPAYAFVNSEDAELLSAPLGTAMLPKGARLLAAVWEGAEGSGVVTPGERLIAEAPFSRFVPFELLEELRIQLRGTKRARLQPCPCRVPALAATFASVNEAYTRISEKYEPHRRSHTGNVFTKVLFLRYTSGGQEFWSPLEDLRQQLETKLERRFQQKQRLDAATDPS